MSAARALRFDRLALTDSSCGSLWMEMCGVEIALRPSGALWVPSCRTLVAADLHLEKGSFFAAKGQLLPPFDTAETLQRLDVELAELRPATLVLLGDSFHDARALSRIATADALRLQTLGIRRDLIWVVGNHDALGRGLGALPGDWVEQVSLSKLALRHEPLTGAAPGEVCGHLHPCVKLVNRGRSLRRRAFLTDGDRLIMPAFGAYAGGLNARDRAFAALFSHAPIAAALGERRVHPLPFTALSDD